MLIDVRDAPSGASPISPADEAVERAFEEISCGRPIVLLDGSIGGGVLVQAADATTPESMSFIVRHSCGLVCIALPGQTLGRLGIPVIPNQYSRPGVPAFAVSVDAASGISTGISAADRARTAKVLADPSSGPEDLVRPGHLVPVRARGGGLLEHAGQAEAAVDLVRFAGRGPAAVFAALVEDGGELRSSVGCCAFAEENDLAMVSITELLEYLRRSETTVTSAAGSAFVQSARKTASAVVRRMRGRWPGAGPDAYPGRQDWLRGRHRWTA